MQLNRTFARAAAVVMLCAATIGVATAAKHERVESAIAGSTIRFVGPYYSTQQSFDSTAGGQVGGEVRIYLAGSGDTLRIGDVVYESGANTADKSATASNHEHVLGVVVGGASTAMACSLLSADVATIAALPFHQVIVLRRGRTYVRVDSITATDTVHAGDRIKPSTLRAGWVMPAATTLTATISIADTSKTVKGSSVSGPITVAGDGFNKVFGTAVKLAVPGETVLVDVNAK